MTENDQTRSLSDRRSDARKPPEKYYSVQFSVKDLGYFYQFKIWDVSSKGMCILVGEDSSVVDHLHVGDIIKMQYYLSEYPQLYHGDRMATHSESSPHQKDMPNR